MTSTYFRRHLPFDHVRKITPVCDDPEFERALALEAKIMASSPVARHAAAAMEAWA
jgi:hypothetical protein